MMMMYVDYYITYAKHKMSEESESGNSIRIL